MISGGDVDGDSNRVHKRHSRVEYMVVGAPELKLGPILGFRHSDLEGLMIPHNDALITRATIANYNVTQILVDTGSSVNILF